MTVAAVLISGDGTNLQALIDAVAARELDVNLGLVLSNEPTAGGLVRASSVGIKTAIVNHRDFSSRDDFDRALIETLSPHHPDIIILAGFMRILTPAFINHFAGRIFNIHPSLLPKYPGLDTHEKAMANGDQWHGSTVHFATAELDGGPRIMQGRVPVLADDSPQSLATRVLEVEHRIYPKVVELFVTGRLAFADGHAWLDGTRLNQPLQYDVNSPH
jgi:phosphoribosylglycinamide formyltransferase-1